MSDEFFEDNDLSFEDIHIEGQESVHYSSDDKDVPEIALSVICQGKKIGAAYYNFDTEHLYLMPDYSVNATFNSIINILLKQVQPHSIITTCKTDEKIVNILKDECNKRMSNVQTSSSFLEESNVLLLPNIDFAYASSRHHLENLPLQNIPQNINSIERKIYTSSLIDFTKACMVKAAGGLLKFVGKQSLHLEHTQPLVSTLSTFFLKNIVNIDENTYKALQIFHEEKHPSVYKSACGVIEGLSLFGICNMCKSSIGRKELRYWFLLPTNELSIIEERHTAIQYFSLAEKMEIVSALQNSLKHIKYLPKILSRMKTGQASMNDWKTLYKTSYHGMIIAEICHSNSSSLPIFQEIGETCLNNLFRVVTILDKVIDFEEYARQNHFAVKMGIDPEIDKMKRIYNGLPDFMTHVAQQELLELHTDIKQCSVIYLPQLGYLLAIPITEYMKESKDYSLPNLKFMFMLNNTVHYKSNNTRKLDALLGDTLCDIYDKETYILHRLQNMILELKNVFFSMMNLYSKLDCLIALATAAKEFVWVKPEITKDQTFYILKARHPLQELCVTSFVANDIFSGGQYSKIKILTGPNSSGKSTYLKQIALIAFMAHVGSFVPAQSAQIPLLDALFSCVHVMETVSVNLSSFLISTNQLSSCLSNSMANSLVIIDEFGKDTESCSGLSLLMAAIKFLLKKLSSVPHVFIATHYLSINSFIPPNQSISFQTIDMTLREELIFFYQLIEGVSVSSYATYVAIQAGLSEKIVERCNAITNDITQNLPVSVQELSFLSQSLKKYMSIYSEFSKLDINSEDMFEFVRSTIQSLPQSRE